MAHLLRKTPMDEPEPKVISETEYARLLKRADELVGCIENSPEEKELEAIAASQRCRKLGNRAGYLFERKNFNEGISESRRRSLRVPLRDAWSQRAHQHHPEGLSR